MAGPLSLLYSRKFWLVIVSIAGLIVMLGTKQIDYPTFCKMAAGLVAVLVAAIAHEDHGAKSGNAARRTRRGDRRDALVAQGITYTPRPIDGGEQQIDEYVARRTRRGESEK